MNKTKSELEEIAMSLPAKRICIETSMADSTPYMDRYYVGTTANGGTDVWLHRIHRQDGRRLHNHPFNARGIVLHGGYLEELEDRAEWRLPTGDQNSALIHLAKRGIDELVRDVRVKAHAEQSPFIWHRIARVLPDTWTLLAVDKERLPYWYFKDPRDAAAGYTRMTASPRDWWRELL